MDGNPIFQLFIDIYVKRGRLSKNPQKIIEIYFSSTYF